VYRRGSTYVAVYRREGHQRKESAATFAEARGIKLARDAETRVLRLGPTLHDYALKWVRRHGGSGHDTVRERTREEYHRLLVTYALKHFKTDIRLARLDRRKLQEFITFLTHCPGRKGPHLSDRSIHNALTPLRLCLQAAATEGLIDKELDEILVLPKRRGGGRWYHSEARFLTPETLGRLLGEIPPAHESFFVLLASTGLRISEAIALRWCDLDLDASEPRLRVRRAIVNGVVGPPKSRHGARSILLNDPLAGALRALRPSDANADDVAFLTRNGQLLSPANLRNRVLRPAAARADVPGIIGHHTLRHTCASLLIAKKEHSMLSLSRWMGHHSAAYTLETYGHLFDGGLGGALEPNDLGIPSKNADQLVLL
jgi:integrase